jgi:hypothetical protein
MSIPAERYTRDRPPVADEERAHPRFSCRLKSNRHRASRLRCVDGPVRSEAEKQRQGEVRADERISGRCNGEPPRIQRSSISPLLLDNRPYADRGEDGDERDQDAADTHDAQTVALLLMRTAPSEDRFGEDVVIELIRRRGSIVRARCDRPQNAAGLSAAELVEHWENLRLFPLRPLGEIDAGVGDLRAAAAYKERKAIRSNILFLAP